MPEALRRAHVRDPDRSSTYGAGGARARLGQHTPCVVVSKAATPGSIPGSPASPAPRDPRRQRRIRRKTAPSSSMRSGTASPERDDDRFACALYRGVTMATSEFAPPLLRRRSAWDRSPSLGPTRRGKWPARPLDPTPTVGAVQDLAATPRPTPRV